MPAGCRLGRHAHRRTDRQSANYGNACVQKRLSVRYSPRRVTVEAFQSHQIGLFCQRSRYPFWAFSPPSLSCFQQHGRRQPSQSSRCGTESHPSRAGVLGGREMSWKGSQNISRIHTPIIHQKSSLQTRTEFSYALSICRSNFDRTANQAPLLRPTTIKPAQTGYFQ